MIILIDEIEEYYQDVRDQLVERNLKLTQRKELELKIDKLAGFLEQHKNVRLVLQTAAAKAQSQLAEHLAGIVSTALATVFTNPYSCVIEFVERRNTSECDIFLERDGEQYHPLTSTGGGVSDVCSLALRVAYLLLSGKRNVLILDEPARHVDADSRVYVAELLRHLQKEFKLQIICVTHSPELIECANKIFTIKQDGSVACKQG